MDQELDLALVFDQIDQGIEPGALLLRKIRPALVRLKDIALVIDHYVESALFPGTGM